MSNDDYKEYLPLVAFVGSIVAAYIAYTIHAVLFYSFHAIIFLTLLTLILARKKEWISLSALLMGLFVGANFFLIRLPFRMYLVFLAVLVSALLIFIVYDMLWKKDVTHSASLKDEVFKEKDELQHRYEIKQESLSNLQMRVDEIFHLFEIAKDFNECISFHEIGTILTHKFLREVEFERGYLTVLEGKRTKTIAKVFRFDHTDWTDELEYEALPYDFEDVTIYLQKNRRAFKILDAAMKENYAFVGHHDVSLPVWIFPLLIEDTLIAHFILEGGKEDDFSKLGIIAGQLALQIKKIALYNTVKELSITDGLTGVFLRRHFLERFDEELKRTVKNSFDLTVLMLDIDHFKRYNDTFGHLVGDVTLKEVSQIIKDSVRKVDLIARYGGEEFAIVLPETSKIGGLEAAERIRSAVFDKKFHVYDEETRVSVSIGVASYPEDVQDAAHGQSDALVLELLQKADQALYKAKGAGRDRVVSFSKEM